MLDLLAAGRLKVSDLVTHCYDIGEAAAAYELIEKGADPYLAIQLSYPATAAADAPVVLRPPAPSRGSSAGSSPGPEPGRHSGSAGSARARSRPGR